MPHASSSSFTTPKCKPRSRKAMIEFLVSHPRYDTMSSWNRSTSYARCVKLPRIDFPNKEAEDAAYDIIGSDTEWWYDSGMRRLIREFEDKHAGTWQIGSNGRSSGYLVLYQGERKPTKYQSFCEDCGQRNYAHILMFDETQPEQAFKKFAFEHMFWRDNIILTQSDVTKLEIPEARMLELLAEVHVEYVKRNKNVTTNNYCGRCKEQARVNYDKIPLEQSCWAGRDTDMGEDFVEWDTESIRHRVDIVMDFDRTVDQIIKAFVLYCSRNVVVEKTIKVSKTVRVVQRK